MQQKGLPSAKQLARELAILNDPFFQQQRPELLSLVRRLQEARCRSDVRSLQIDLIAFIGALERSFPEVELEQGAAARRTIDRLKTLEPKSPATRQELREANRLLSRLKHVGAVVDALRHAARVLFDGVVWEVFDYDRSALALTSRRPLVARHADEKGFSFELRSMDQYEKQLDTVVFHNDSSYCLRFGDITAVRELGGRRVPESFEVKVGRSQAVRQWKAINEIEQLIRENRLLLPVPFATHLSEVDALIGEAAASGYAAATFDCRFVQVIDYRHFGGREEKVAEILASEEARLGWFTNDRLILAGIAGAARIRDRGDPVRELAPLSIFPFAPEHVTDVLMGAVDIRVHLNTELLALAFKARGLGVEFFRSPASARSFLHAQRGYAGVIAPAYLREQMLYELMESESLIDLLTSLLDSRLPLEWASGKPPPTFIGFADESPAWREGPQISLAH